MFLVQGSACWVVCHYQCGLTTWVGITAQQNSPLRLCVAFSFINCYCHLVATIFVLFLQSVALMVVVALLL